MKPDEAQLYRVCFEIDSPRLVGKAYYTVNALDRDAAERCARRAAIHDRLPLDRTIRTDIQAL